MARIRTIKPEFPQSESMGRVSRDARLLFLMLFTVVDDAGRTRAAPRMLASLLYPYDDDAKTHIVEWLLELERQRCLTLYEVDGNAYLQIEKWLDHQKIDRPSPSRLPAIPSKPRCTVAKPREDAATDLVPSTLDLGSGIKDQSKTAPQVPALPAKAKKLRRSLPDDFPLPEDLAWSQTRWLQSGRADLCAAEAEEVRKFRDHHTSQATTSADWSASWRTWASNAIKFNRKPNGTGTQQRSFGERKFDNLKAGASRAASMDREGGQGVEGAGDNLVRLALSHQP